MTTTSPGSDRFPPIFCSSEWHLRDNPRAFMIYSLALRITEGGKNEFYLSQPQLAQYFNWDVKTVRTAFRALRAEGLFKLLREGRGGNGQANFASVYRVIPHSQLGSATECWPTVVPDRHRTDTELMPGDRGKTGSTPLPKTGAYPLPKTGTLVSEDSTKKSTNPSQSAGLACSASPLKGKTNVNRSPLPEGFRPDPSNEQYAKRHNLDLEDELSAFSDLHLSIGNERKNWQAVFRNHLVNAAFQRGRISAPDWVPAKEWTAYLDMRERIRKPTTEAAQQIAIRILDELRGKGQSVAAVLNQSTHNEWTGLFEVGTGPRGKRVPRVTTGSLTANYKDMMEKCEAMSKAAIAEEAARKASNANVSASGQPV